MALSGSFTGSILDGHYEIRVDWTATQSVPNNSSTITCKLYFINSWNIDIGTRNHTINIGGTNYSLSSGAINTTGTHYIGQVAKVIAHNADGTSPSVSLSAIFDFRATIQGTFYSTINASGSATFDTIPRASTITLNTNTQYIGSNITIYTNRASSSFTHNIVYYFGNLSGVVATGVGDSYTWTLPSTLYSQIPNATVGVGALCLETYLGSTKVGDTTQILYYPKCVESSCKPTLNFNSLSESTAGLSDAFSLNGTTQFINTLSRITANYSSVSCKNYATFSKVNLIIGGASIETTSSSATSLSLGSGVNFNSGSLTATLMITDSRGYTNSYSKNITVYNYAKPTVNSSVSRLNNYENETTITPKATIQVINNSYKNLYFRYALYEKGATNPGYLDILSPTVNSITGEVTAPNMVVNLDNTKEYILEIYIHDGYNEKLETYLINRGSPLLFINSENGDLEVSGSNITANGAKVYSKKLLWQGKLVGNNHLPGVVSFAPYSELIVKYVSYGVTGYTHVDLTTPLSNVGVQYYSYEGSSVVMRKTNDGYCEFHYNSILVNSDKNWLYNKAMGYYATNNSTINDRNNTESYYIDTIWGVY